MRTLLFILLLLPLGLQSQEKTIFKNLDVFELEWAQNPQISPDGKLIKNVAVRFFPTFFVQD